MELYVGDGRYVCKHLTHLFPKRVSYTRFEELEKEIVVYTSSLSSVDYASVSRKGTPVSP